MKCAKCGKPATKKVIWADGRAYQPSCDADVSAVQEMLTRKNGKMTELSGVQDLSEDHFQVIDLVSSAVYPGLERKPGGPDNWVERAGGLPSYIERIAKHLHYEKGMSISRAIAVAVNTVKRWAMGGTVTEHGTTKRVSAKTQAQAAAALASWEAKRVAGRVHLSEPVSASSAGDAPSATLSVSVIDLAEMVVDLQALAERAGQVSDPQARAVARQSILDLAVPSSKLTAEKRRQYAKDGTAMGDGSFPVFDEVSLRSACRLARTPAQRRHVIKRARALGLMDKVPDDWKTDLAEEFRVILDMASTIPPRNARGKAKDGRKSFKRQGKWGHGFVPLDQAAKEAKAKGSPIAMNRMNRLFGKVKKAATGRAGGRSAPGKNNPTEVNVDEKSFPGSERARSVGALQRTPFEDKANKDLTTGGKKATLPKSQKEASKASRVPERARQNWNEIPAALKTVRNGKRYVLAEFGGKQYVTEWVGGVHEVSQTSADKRKVMRTVTSADAAKMTSAQLRDLIDNPRTPAALKTQLRKELRGRTAKEKVSA